MTSVPTPNARLAVAGAATGLWSAIKRQPVLAPARKLIRSVLPRKQPEGLVDVLAAFPMFAPNSPGGRAARSEITVKTITTVFDQVGSLLDSVASPRECPLRGIESSIVTDADQAAADQIKALFDRYGSDKATFHNYHLLYGPLLSSMASVEAVLEVGIGSNDVSVVSNMGQEGKPGASLRALRDFLPAASIYGADIDPKILFTEERISTFLLNQTDARSFAALEASISSELDLMIDDGLHSPDANIATLAFGLRRVRVGGWVVIEDICDEALPIWKVVAALLPLRFDPALLRAEEGNLFVVRRLA